MHQQRRSARLLLLASLVAGACSDQTPPTAVPDGLHAVAAANANSQKVKVKSMQLSSNTLRIDGPSVSGTVSFGNSGLAIPENVLVRGDITQGNVTKEAVNTPVQCPASPEGKLTTGTCTMSFAAVASNAGGGGALNPGSATFTLRVIQTGGTGDVELANKSVLVNLVATPSVTATLSPLTLQIDGPAATATVVIQNPASTLQGVRLQGWIVQGSEPNATRKPTGGSLVTCGSNAGVMPPGTCTMTLSVSATNAGPNPGSLVSGPATFELSLIQSSGSVNTTLDVETVPITLVWGVPRLTRLEVQSTSIVIGGDAVGYTVDIQNDGAPRSNVIVIAQILQFLPSGSAGKWADGATVSCGGADGELPTTGTGVCTIQSDFVALDDGAGGEQLIAGAAELVVDLMDNTGIIDRRRTNITLVDKPARINFITMSPAVFLGGSPASYIATLQNNTGATMSNVALQNWISQGTARRSAGGALLECNGVSSGELPTIGCGSRAAVVAMNAPHSGTGTLLPGPATLEVYLQQTIGGTTVVLDTAFIPIDLVVVAPGIIGLELSAPNVLIGEQIDYTVTLYNPTIATITDAGIQGFLSQGTITDFGTGGTDLTCEGAAQGEFPPGVCVIRFTLNTRNTLGAPDWQPGESTFRLELSTGDTVLDSKSLILFLNIIG